MSTPEKQVWIIRHAGPGFYMVAPDGKRVECNGPCTPRHLARIAWARGADEVRHDYDLTLAPDGV